MKIEVPQVQEVTCEIVVTRADGTVEDLGVVSRTVYEKENLPWQT